MKGETKKYRRKQRIFEQGNTSTKKGKKESGRKRVSFDLRTDLHKELKMQRLVQGKNIYILVEEALEKYLKEKK